MKKLIVALALTSSMGMALAQNMPPPPDKPLPVTTQESVPEQFSQRKAKLLQHLEEQQRRVSEHISCVKSATEPAALKNCRPARGPRGERPPHAQASSDRMAHGGHRPRPMPEAGLR
jgi:hypothetical protein